MKKNKIMEGNISLFLIISLVAVSSYMFFEPQLVEAVDDTIGVTQTVTGEININCDATAALTPSIAGQTGGSSTGSFNCTVETSDVDGYTLTLLKNQTLQTAGGGANKQFDDYVGNTPLDYAWGAPAAGTEKWGFNITAGADAEVEFEDNGSTTCGSGAPSANHCWDEIPTTPAKQVANASAATAVGGTQTDFAIKAEAGGSNNLQSGAYACTITATALVK